MFNYQRPTIKLARWQAAFIDGAVNGLRAKIAALEATHAGQGASAMYRFLITDPTPDLHACTYQPSVRAPGKTICVSENGLALVVEPGGLVRDLRENEEADSPWCWADACGDLLVYRPDAYTIVAFRMVIK